MAINGKTKATVDTLLTNATTTESQFKTGLTDVTTQIESINAVVDVQGLNIGSTTNAINALEAEYDAHIVAYNAHIANYNSKILTIENTLNTHNHDDRYYTEAEADGRFLGISAKAVDSNLLDGIDSASFVRSDQSDTMSGSYTITGSLTVGSSTSSTITMVDTDEGNRALHCNSNRIGFLNQAGSWSAYSSDSGEWVVENNIYATGNVTAYSDRSVKENIEVIPNALAKVNSVGGYTFDRIDMLGMKQTGVIAQEIQEILPEAVMEMPDGKLSVAYGNIVGLLIEAIKELSAEVDKLKGA